MKCQWNYLRAFKGEVWYLMMSDRHLIPSLTYLLMTKSKFTEPFVMLFTARRRRQVPAALTWLAVMDMQLSF